MGCANIAATIHAHMCECAKHGYTQGSGRWGSGEPCAVEVEGNTYTIAGGDRDCSSSVIDAWRHALVGTSFEGRLDGATYTGNMRSVFVNSGLFEWQPMSFIAQRGDIYLNEVNHTAMCQSAEPDMLSEFLLNELGGITGGAVGDQTGGESVVRAFWTPSFGWDGILHYNGQADKELDMPTVEEIWSYDINGVQARDRLQGIDQYGADNAATAVWEREIGGVQARDRLQGVDAIQLPQLTAQVAALSEAVKALAESKDVDPGAVAQSVSDAVSAKLESLKIEVS